MERTTLNLTRVAHLDTPALRRVWAAAIRELKTNTAAALYSLERSTPADMVHNLLCEVVTYRSAKRKTGRRVWYRATTSGGVDRMVDEVDWDEAPAREALLRVFAAAGVEVQS